MIPELVDMLKSLDLIGRATYVAYGTTDQQRVIQDLASIKSDSCDYFSMVLISIRKRKGVLRGNHDDSE
jgi:precorrin-2/cobalt-factor-2 C20-methyltransferase